MATETQAFPWFRALTLTWLVLVTATLLGSWLGETETRSGTGGPWLVGLVIVISFAKAWAVGIEFMQLRRAPLVLRWLFEGWIVATAGALVALSTQIPLSH